MSKLKKKKKKKERTKVDRRHGGNKCDSLPQHAASRLKEMRDRDEQRDDFHHAVVALLCTGPLWARNLLSQRTHSGSRQKKWCLCVCVLIVGNDRLGEYCSEKKIKILE
jgi:hypothetical protein